MPESDILAGKTILIAPQALKGSLDAVDVGAAIAEGVRRVVPSATLATFPLADGGEGLTHALIEATDGRFIQETVTGPLGAPVQATWGILGSGGADATVAGSIAVIEMAAAAGLPLVPAAQRDATRATTRGVGELIRRALDAGCDEIILGLGGSATNDGGAGMAQALGVHLRDSNGAELPPGGAALANLASIALDDLDPRLARVRLTVACDVRNPLTGPEGASAIYGPQKGATPAQVAQLDAALSHYAAAIARDVGRVVADTPGAGAAGGMGAGLLAFTEARLESGAPLVMRASGMLAALPGAALVITAEGRLDAQTAYGKVVGAVAEAARAAGVPVIALAGSIALSREELRALGINVALPLADGPMTLADSMRDARRLLSDATARALDLLALGAALRQAGDDAL